MSEMLPPPALSQHTARADKGCMPGAGCYLAAPGYHETHLNGVRLESADDESTVGPAT